MPVKFTGHNMRSTKMTHRKYMPFLGSFFARGRMASNTKIVILTKKVRSPRKVKNDDKSIKFLPSYSSQWSIKSCNA